MDPARDLRAGVHEVPLEAGTRAIGDLHLDPAGEGRIETFAAWCEGLGGCPRLVVLGDLFDVWVGPAQARMAGARAVTASLAGLVRRGCAVDVVPGNRDFLLGRSFEIESGARVRDGGFVGLAAGRRVLFVHGDELCTLDLPYQRMKRILRSRPMRALAPRLPLWVARRAAARLRRRSRSAVAAKPRETTAMQADACRRVAEVARADAVLCGHAHRFRDEALDGGPRWLVLDAWGGARDVLRLEEGGDWSARSSRGRGPAPAD